jgi:DNA-binding MarR family transcriptional regulator
VRTSSARPARPGLTGDVEVLQAATRVMTGVALRSLEVLDGAVSLPQFRMLAVLADLGQARSAQVARALSLEPSTVTRLADRLVAAGRVARGSEPGHRGVVTLELTATGTHLVDLVYRWRQEEFSRIMSRLPAAQRAKVTGALQLLIDAAGPGYGAVCSDITPVLR